MVDSLAWSQPALFELPSAIRLVFEALIDPDDQTAVLSIEARRFPSRELIALMSTAPIPFEGLDRSARRLGIEFTRLLREYTGPFSD